MKKERKHRFDFEQRILFTTTNATFSRLLFKHQTRCQKGQPLKIAEIFYLQSISNNWSQEPGAGCRWYTGQITPRDKKTFSSFRQISTEWPKNTSLTQTLLHYILHVTVVYGTSEKLEREKKSNFCQYTPENSRLPSWKFPLGGSNKKRATDNAFAASSPCLSLVFVLCDCCQPIRSQDQRIGWLATTNSCTFMNKRWMRSKRSLDLSHLVRTATAILHAKLGWSK